MNKTQLPPKLPLRFFRWYCHPDYMEDIEGDLLERYGRLVEEKNIKKARWGFTKDVIRLFRPGIIRPLTGYEKLNNYGMIKSYFTLGWRNLVHNKGYSLLNIAGLSLGIAVAMLIGLWVVDEFSFNERYEHYNNIAQVLQNNTIDGEVGTWSSQSYQLGPALRTNYSNYFKHVVTSTFPMNSILAIEDKKFTITGSFMDEQAPELLSLQMLQGTRDGLHDPTSLMISESVAQKFFDNGDALGKVLRIDNNIDLKITGVYKDLPSTDSFKDELNFVAPLEAFIERGGTYLGWGNNWLQVFVTTAENIDFDQASIAIKDVKANNILENDFGASFNPQLFLQPMSKWRLYSGFENGVNTGGRIEFVWIFGMIGIFVVLLACINFMNLSTARSQKRAKEVGVRKVIGSARGQLAGQFFIESLLVVTLAFVFGILISQISLAWFNGIADKNIFIPWISPSFWLVIISSIATITIISSSYPAIFLSGFKPIKALKGSFKLGRNASLPRKVLVIVQFTVSITLIIGTIVVYKQIQFAKQRPLGYELDGLVNIPVNTREVIDNYEKFRNELMTSSLIAEVSASETSVTNIWPSDGGFQWEGKDPAMQDHIYRGAVSHDFGKTVGWKIVQGRDFSRDFLSDSSAMILNEAAVRYMGLKDPVGQTIRIYGNDYEVIGVAADMLSQSIYEANRQTAFIITPARRIKLIHVKIDANASTRNAIAEISRVFASYNVETPFEYTFADNEFAEKYAFEERIGKLVGVFSTLAIFISCLGLFGLASFMAEQRSKEIGIRKVIGASVFSLWKLLSRDFVILVIIAVIISIPLGYYFMSDWLLDYTYRTEVSWWIFAVSALGALLVTLSTISYQAIRAAMTNPINTLKSE